jgi:hypothetical protein
MEPGVYTNNYSLRGTSFTPADGFPPEPAYLTSVTAAIIERDGNVRTISAHGISGPDHESDSSELIQTYQKGVGRFQDQVPAFESAASLMDLPDTYPRLGRLGSWCVGITQAESKRLVAMNMIFRAVSGRLHTGLTYHVAIKDQFPLMIRELLEPVALGEIDEQVTDSLQKAMRNDESAQVVAGVPASATLPPVKKFKAGLTTHTRHKSKKSESR